MGATSPAVATSLAGATRAGWPCVTCAVTVPWEAASCPACGSAFLSRLAGDTGRHRSSDRKAGSDALRSLPRGARLASGLVVGILLAVLVPVLLALLD